MGERRERGLRKGQTRADQSRFSQTRVHLPWSQLQTKIRGEVVCLAQTKRRPAQTRVHLPWSQLQTKFQTKQTRPRSIGLQMCGLFRDRHIAACQPIGRPDGLSRADESLGMPHGVKTDPTVRALALDMADELGVAETAARMGIHGTTIQKWQGALGRAGPGVHPNSVEGTRQYWADWRHQAALQAAETVQQGFDLATKAAQLENSRNFRESVQAASMAIESVMKLTGANVAHSTHAVSIQVDVGYGSDQLAEFARIENLRREAIEASSAPVAHDMAREAIDVHENAVVTNE